MKTYVHTTPTRHAHAPCTYTHIQILMAAACVDLVGSHYVGTSARAPPRAASPAGGHRGRGCTVEQIPPTSASRAAAAAAPTDDGGGAPSNATWRTAVGCADGSATNRAAASCVAVAIRSLTPRVAPRRRSAAGPHNAPGRAARDGAGPVAWGTTTKCTAVRVSGCGATKWRRRTTTSADAGSGSLRRRVRRRGCRHGGVVGDVGATAIATHNVDGSHVHATGGYAATAAGGPIGPTAR